MLNKSNFEIKQYYFEQVDNFKYFEIDINDKNNYV